MIPSSGMAPAWVQLKIDKRAVDDWKRVKASSFLFPSSPARFLFFFSPASRRHREASAAERGIVKSGALLI